MYFADGCVYVYTYLHTHTHTYALLYTWHCHITGVT